MGDPSSTAPKEICASFIKASALLALKDAAENPWFHLGLIRCSQCMTSVFAGCHSLEGEDTRVDSMEPTPEEKRGQNGSTILRRGDKICGTGSNTSMCTIPTLTCSNQINSTHLQCASGRCSTMHIIGLGCTNSSCRATPEHLRIHRVRAQRSEFHFAVSVFKEVLGTSVHHSILKCSECNAIGFPGAEGRLTIVKEMENDAGIKHVHPFWCSKTESGMSPTAWNSSFVHFKGCSLINSTPLALHVNITFKELYNVYNSLASSINMRRAKPEVMVRQHDRLQKRLQWSALFAELEIYDRHASSLETVHPYSDLRLFSGMELETLRNMIKLCLEVKYELQATFIFDKPFNILKQSLCEAMKKKREYLSEKEVWSIEHKKLVGILLRVIKTLTAENIKTSTIQGCNDSHERDVMSEQCCKFTEMALIDGSQRKTREVST